MIEELFALLKDANTELNLPQEVTKLEQMQDIYNKKEYFVAFIGQFSAGKSYLINNLLERKLLPQGITETTPLLTYIRYNDEFNDLNECAVLHFQNGASEKISLEEVANIIQKSDDIKWDIENIDYLEIYLQEEILKNGMILLDTPGVNTIIERHEQLLANSLLLSSKIIYVDGHSPSQVDVDKMTMFKQQGFNVSFVRTHCDEIKSSEESVDQVIDTDLKILEQCGLTKSDCYFVSNINSSEWFADIAKIREALVNIGKDVATLLEQDTNSQLVSMANNCIVELEKVKQVLEEKNNNDTQVLEDKKRKIEDKIRALEEAVKMRQEKFDKKINECKQNVDTEARAYSQKAIERSVSKIINSNVSDDNSMLSLVNREKQQILQNLLVVINSQIDPMLAQINENINVNFELPTINLPNMEHYQDVVNMQDDEIKELQEKLTEIKSKKDKLIEKMDNPDNEDIKNQIVALESELMAEKQRYDVENNRPPKMIEVRDDSAGELGRQIGGLVDLALLVAPLPGPGKVTALMKVKKFFGIAQKVSKVQKAGQIALKAANALKVVKNAGIAENVSCLDYLTAEHWGKKIGESLGAPPRLIIDKDYEEQRQEQINNLREQILDKQRRVYQMKFQMDTFRNEEERKKAEKESLIVNEQQLEKEIKTREQQMRKSARENALKNWKRVYAEWYGGVMREQTDKLLEDYLKDLPARLKEYQNSRLTSVQYRLNQEKENYEQLLNIAPSEISKRLEKVNSLINALKIYCA